MTVNATKRINVTFPVELLDEMRRLLPSRERNSFIVAATEEAMRREKLGRVLTELREKGPIWSDEDHPDLNTVEDVNRFVRSLREASMPKTWDDFVEESEQGMEEARQRGELSA